MPHPGAPRDCVTCGHAEGFHTFGVAGACGAQACKCRAFVDPPSPNPRIGMHAVAAHSLVEHAPWRIDIVWDHYGMARDVSIGVEEAEELLSSLISAIEAVKRRSAESLDLTRG